ncbi:hypothetical protein C2S52_001218 [Perilla frutescens var. hirtella]|nr:hypothetical protein C2S51_007266 [Perilla frutescens var. frutescens]KAH6800754.1 hypothetical protein C2S52_001218 [Perilla frutescens var. hirtella]
MIPRWATTSQQKALSRAWQKSSTILAKTEGKVCDRAHNNPRVIERRRRGDWAQGKQLPATAGAMHSSRRRKEDPQKRSQIFQKEDRLSKESCMSALLRYGEYRICDSGSSK